MERAMFYIRNEIMKKIFILLYFSLSLCIITKLNLGSSNENKIK